jgi:hypothetical protein
VGLELGIFVVPDATNAAATVAQIIEADGFGLDMVGVQDHPYQWRFFDTWMLLAYVAGRTERVRFLPDVVNLPLRLPTMIAKSVASLDSLSGGRVRSFASARCWSASRNGTPLPSCGASARRPGRACASCSAEPQGHHHYRRQ